MAPILFIVAFAIVMFGIGWSLVRVLDQGHQLSLFSRIPISFLIGCFVIYFGVFFIGIYRLDAFSMYTLGGFCFLIAIPGLAKTPWREFGAVFKSNFKNMLEDKFYGLLCLATIFLAILGLLYGLAPPSDWDSIAYHLALPQHDIEIGRVTTSWDQNLTYAYFPAMGGNLTRFSLAVMNDSAAQMIHGLFAIAAAISAAAFARNLGYNRHAAVLAALFFLACRFVVWQMGSVEVDVPLGAFVIASILSYSAWRKDETVGLAVLFGLLVGGGILLKLHGLVVAVAIAPLILYDLATRRGVFFSLSCGPFVALLVFVPHMIRVYLETNNPIFPLFNSFFNPGGQIYFQGLENAFGTGRGLIDVLLGPWYFSVQPMQHFDGMVLGAPYLLVFAPFVIFNRENRKRWAPWISIALFYYVLWFFLLSQQVRFLGPILPILTTLAAAGCVVAWNLVRGHMVSKVLFIALTLVLGLNQIMFVGVYALLRLPVALGFKTKLAYLTNTPTFNHTNYATCNYIRERLKPGEKYFSNVGPFLSYYCPQIDVVYKFFSDEDVGQVHWTSLPKMAFGEFFERAEKANFRFFMVSTASESRHNDTAKSVFQKSIASDYRFGEYLEPVLEKMTPLVSDAFTAVYDGREVIRLLRSELEG